MAADHPENTSPDPENEDPGAEDEAQAPQVAGAVSDASNENQTSIPPDEPRKVIKRPAPGDLAQLRASGLFKSQLSAAATMRNAMGGSAAEQMRKAIGGSAAEQMRKAMGGSAAEQMRKAMGGSVVEQMQNIVGGSLGEQMRQAQRALHPLNSLQDTIRQLTRTALESPMQRLLDDQASSHRRILEALNPKWNQTLVGHAFTQSLSAIQSFQSIHHAEILRTQNAVHQQFQNVGSLLESLRSKLPSFTEISDYWRDYPARVKENLVALASAGWYLDPEMAVSDIVHFKEDLENDSAEEVSAELAVHFQSSLQRIEETLCADHPSRAHLIKEAFAAHREGKYSLSIPALFAQADGICFDLTGYCIFTGTGVFRFAKRIDPETIERAYLEPLLRAIPIKDSSQQRRAKMPQLNRHAVMHGESKDFPTEHNGLKAISFINFVSHVLGMAVSRQKEIAKEKLEGAH